MDESLAEHRRLARAGLAPGRAYGRLDQEDVRGPRITRRVVRLRVLDVPGRGGPDTIDEALLHERVRRPLRQPPLSVQGPQLGLGPDFDRSGVSGLGPRDARARHDGSR